MSFSSDFIVGFPGETKDDFMGTMDVINEVRFDESFSLYIVQDPILQHQICLMMLLMKKKRKD